VLIHWGMASFELQAVNFEVSEDVGCTGRSDGTTWFITFINSYGSKTKSLMEL
jgi:hypothetical protein